MRTSKTFLLLVLSALVFFSCGRKTTTDGADTSMTSSDSGPTERVDVLTGVYRGNELILPAGVETQYPTAYTCASPLIDAETGQFTCWLRNGAENLLAVVDPARGVESTTPLPVPEGEMVIDGVFSHGLFYALTSEPEVPHTHYWLNTFDPESGTWNNLGEISSRFGTSETDPLFNVSFLEADLDGGLWLTAPHETVVLNADGALLCSFDGTFNHRPAASPAGTVYLPVRSGVLIADKTSGTTKSVPLPEEPLRIVFGEGFDFFCSTASGIFGVTFAEEGNAQTTELMNYANSGIDTSRSAVWAMLAPECFLFSESIRENGTERQGLMLYRSSDDVRLSSLRTVEIALTVSLNAEPSLMEWETLIVEYNKSHPDSRIVLRDYTQYNNTENLDGGSRKLATEMVTGIYQPDLILGFPSDIAVTTAVEKGMYADLAPFMAQDDTVNRENLFGAVLRMMDDGKDGIWGLPSSLTLSGPITTKDMLDAYAPGVTEASGWTMDQLINFAEHLPAEVEFYEWLTQENADKFLLGSDGYTAFIKDGKADFENPSFLRWLNFYAGLPNNTQELARVSELEKASELEKVDFYYNGKVALRFGYYYSAGNLSDFEAKYHTKEWAFPGFPSENGNGSGVETGAILLMSSSCAEKELAWDLIRTIYMQANGGFGIPILKSRFDSIMAAELRRTYVLYFSGNSMSLDRNPDNPFTEADLTEPGIIVEPDEDDIAHIRRLTDEYAGKPLKDRLDPAISDIIAEEISAMTGGVSTPENCAKKIQSRVSIWLAEHK